MEWYWILAALLGSTLALMFIGVPVGIAFILVNTVAAFLLFGRFGHFHGEGKCLAAALDTELDLPETCLGSVCRRTRRAGCIATGLRSVLLIARCALRAGGQERQRAGESDRPAHRSDQTR